MESLESHRNLWNLIRIFGILSESLESYQNLWNLRNLFRIFGISSESLESLESFQNLSKIPESLESRVKKIELFTPRGVNKFWNLVSFRWNLSGIFGIFQESLESF